MTPSPPRRPLRILELRTVRGTGGGPEKTILLGTARTDPEQYAITLCYIRDERDPVFHIDRRAQDLPIDYVEVRERHSMDRRIWPRLVALVKERRIDIVHAHDYKTDFLAWLLGRQTGIIPLATAHGWTGHTPRERYLYYPADRRILARLPRVIAVSSEIRQTLLQAGAAADRVTVVLNGIDPAAFARRHGQEPEARGRFGFAPDDLVIGSVGRLEPQKDFPLLIDAFAAIAAERPRARLVIAGDGSLRQQLAAHIDRLGLQQRCQLLGHVDDITLLHHALDLFVQASVYEGTPNSVLEAMALETPIVATDAGGTAELARDGQEALIVPFKNRAALTGALLAALDNREATRARATAARRRVETESSFDTRRRRVEDIYDQLAGSDQAPSASGRRRHH
jgi:glycosyltransferase involved in cell wall biosynthesis